MTEDFIRANEAQAEALNSIKFSERQEMVTVLPPGAGKTILVALHCKEIKAEHVLYIAPRTEILDQAEKHFRNILSLTKEQTGFIQAARKQFDKNYLFATIQTLSRTETLQTLLRTHPHFNMVIADEYHHSQAPTWEKVLDALKNRMDVFHGITATPYRLDGKDILSRVGGNVIFEMSLKEAIARGINVPFRYIAMWDDVDYDNIKWNGMKYDEKDLDKALRIEARDRAIVREYKNLGLHKKQGLGFCVSVEHAYRMAKQFAMAGIPSLALTHKTPKKVRKQAVEDFRNGRYRMIFSKDLFNEGIDFPEVEGILLLRPTLSKVVFYQQIGRGLRRKEGKTHVTILDFIGNYRKNWEVSRLLTEEIGAQEVTERENNDVEKLLLEYKKVSTVYFEQELIDFWKEQAHKNPHIRAELKAMYLELKKRKKRIPTRAELYKYSKGKYNPSFYFQSYGDMLREFGEPDYLINAINYIPEQEIINTYIALMQKYKRPPTMEELMMNNTLDEIIKMFGSVDNFERHILIK